MTHFRVFVTRLKHYWSDISAKPVTRKEYRNIGIFAVLFTLLMAALVFTTSVEQRWQMAAITAAFSIPASLMGGVLCVAIDRCPKPAKRPETSKKPNLKLLAFNVVFGVSIYLVLRSAIPSKLTLFLVVIAIAAIDYFARRVYRRRSDAS